MKSIHSVLTPELIRSAPDPSLSPSTPAFAPAPKGEGTNRDIVPPPKGSKFTPKIFITYIPGGKSILYSPAALVIIPAATTVPEQSNT